MAVRSLNKVMIIGNLTRDPELRYTANGTAIATFGVATNREYVPANSNEPVEETEFHNVVAWSKLAELCEKLLAKGQKVFIEGRLQTRDWVDSETSKKMYRTEVIAEEMIVLSPGKGSDMDGGFGTSHTENQQTESRVPAGGQQASNNQDEAMETSGEDIPF